jgi:predicted TIM-barrel fold metal-dependent hydrolase
MQTGLTGRAIRVLFVESALELRVKRNLRMLLFVSGILLLLIGLVATPDVLRRLLRPGQIRLHPLTINRLLLYQLLLITLGYVLTSGSALLYIKRYRALLLVPALLLYPPLVYASYIRPRYPENVVLQPAEYRNVWRVLTQGALLLENYDPEPTLVVNRQHVAKARHPVIDIHFHLGSLVNVDADMLVRAMDACGVAKVVNLDGGPGKLERYSRDFRSKYPDRFVMFVRPDLRIIAKTDGWQATGADLEAAVRTGARGVKITKDFGLTLKDRAGSIVPVDDPRLDPLWSKAGELGVPVLMHVSDAAPFFRPVDRFNERYEELKDFPQWSVYGPTFPTRGTLRTQRERLLERHPQTIFIGAHVGMDPEDLGYAGHLLDTYSNYYVDIASTLHELGRQPFTAREFFIKYQDRILFGTDGGYALGTNGWSIERYFRTYFEFLETKNEYFEYPLWGINKQGRWRIYGVNLEDAVLQKIYYKNAARLLQIQ